MWHFSNLSKVALTVMVGLRFKPSGSRTCALNHDGMLPLWLQIPAFNILFWDNSTCQKKITQNCVIYFRCKDIFQPHQVYLVTNVFYFVLLLSDELTQCLQSTFLKFIQSFLFQIYDYTVLSQEEERRKKNYWGFLLILDEYLLLHPYMMSNLIFILVFPHKVTVRMLRS